MSRLTAETILPCATFRQASISHARSTPRPGIAVLLVYGFTLFLSASLLFLIQPLFAKMVLPRLGGTPAVWNTCMVFFQACLLLGYLYAHLTPRWLGVRRQAALHLCLLVIPLLFLPLRLPRDWSPTGDHPILSLLAMLAVSVGVPFFAVSTSGPLLQKWFTSTGHRAAIDPYFLYAAGNTGSLLALVGYPIVCEPFIRLTQQTRLWSVGYGLLSLSIAFCALTVWCYGPTTKCAEPCKPLTAVSSRVRLHWIALAFIPSTYLLGVTTYMTTDIAAVPLFWIVPLSLYLLTFILVFLKTPLMPHALVVRLLPIAIVGTTLFQLAHAAQPIWLVLLIHLTAFFLAAMMCHGELARRRPAAEQLTEFYLMMSVGGVLGGLFNALVAPTFFNRAYEYPIAIIITCLAMPLTGIPVKFPSRRWLDIAIPLGVGAFALYSAVLIPVGLREVRGVAVLISAGVPILICFACRNHRWRFAITVAVLLGVAMFHVPNGGDTLHIRRSFFGVHRIVASGDGLTRELYHGATVHGRQRFDSLHEPIDEPLSYYHRSGPAGDIFSMLPHGRTAVIGLGVGSLAAYARPTEAMTYYEIDPDVRWAAEQSGSFHFLQSARDRGAAVDIVLGDARLTLWRAADAQHDLIVLDAFSGDAVPVHLLTHEAVQLYLSKLNPHGVLAVHTSNIYLDLRPVLASLAHDTSCTFLYREDLDITPEDMAAGKCPSQWVVIARDPMSLHRLTETRHWQTWTGPKTEPWTDDFSNVLSAMRWRQ